MSLDTLKTFLAEFVSDEDGLSATEYSLLFVGLVAVIGAAIALLGGGITSAFQSAADALP